MAESLIDKSKFNIENTYSPLLTNSTKNIYTNTSKIIRIPVKSANYFNYINSDFTTSNCNIKINGNELQLDKTNLLDISGKSINLTQVSHFKRKDLFNKLFIFNNIFSNKSTAYYATYPQNTIILTNSEHKTSRSILIIESNVKLDLINANLIFKVNDGSLFPNFITSTVHNIEEKEYSQGSNYTYIVNLYAAYIPGTVLNSIIVFSKKDVEIDYSVLNISYEIIEGIMSKSKINYNINSNLIFRNNESIINDIKLSLEPSDPSEPCFFNLNSISLKSLSKVVPIKDDLNHNSDSIRNIGDKKSFYNLFNFGILLFIFILLYYSTKYHRYISYAIIIKNIKYLYLLIILNFIFIIIFEKNNLYLHKYSMYVLVLILVDIFIRKLLNKFHISHSKSIRHTILSSLILILCGVLHARGLESLSELIFTPIFILIFAQLYLNIIKYLITFYKYKNL